MDVNTIIIIISEVDRQLKAWNLPLDVSNSVMLTRADCELTKGNLSMADTFYREMMTRISGAWDEHRRKESQKDHFKSSPSLNDESVDQESMDESSIKELSPLILTYRVLYSISVLYRAIGWWTQAKVELCIIMATVPPTLVDSDHFKKDDWYVSNTKKNINFSEKYQDQKFKLMEVTQEGLVVRVIKELMACFEVRAQYSYNIYFLLFAKIMEKKIVISCHLKKKNCYIEIY